MLILQKTFLLNFVLLSLLFFENLASAQSKEEMETLSMFYKEEQLVVTPSRSPKLTSKVAENVSVVTSEEIQAMNAHTLADVLNTVNGVQVQTTGGPGTLAQARIQGSEERHVLVMMDGIELNNLSNNVADIGAIPVQQIERIEIIKGPASSSWGSSLGGIINIITKSPDESRPVGGMASASYGERNTGDYRAEVSGKVSRLGYYLTAGNLVSNGLTTNTPFYENNLYTKLKWDITERTSLVFTLGYAKGSRGEGVFEDTYGNDRFEYLFSSLSVNHSFSDEADVTLSLRTSRQNLADFVTGESTSAFNKEKKDGGSLKFTWEKGIHGVVFGGDYDKGILSSNDIGRQYLETWDFFLNDTISLDPLTLTPGIRYDHTSTNGDFTSPGIGATYRLNEKTIIRGYVARGFSIPPLAYTFGTQGFILPNPALSVESVWSFQAGIETASLKYLWLKTNLFWDEIRNAIVVNANGMSDNEKKYTRRGFELEVGTMPIYYTSLSAGFTFIDARDADTDEIRQDVPRYTYDIGIRYDDKKSFKAGLLGHYIWWNAQGDFGGKYNAFVWDLNLIKKLYSHDKRNIELFFTAHNLFNGSQYLLGFSPNPRRWVEAGMRLAF
jgi:vitamin B12 transporter